MITVHFTGLQTAKQFFRNLRKELRTADLFSRLGPKMRDDVRRRISTGDYGRWEKASKWIEAKKGTTKALQGQEKNIHFKTSTNRLMVYGVTNGGWTFSQHHKGFTNKLYSKKDAVYGGRVFLNLVKPEALPWVDPNRFVFSFIPKKVGVTPARQIWPQLHKAEQMAKSEASKWVFRAVTKAGGSILR